ncbi:hypothetical protein MAM1_0349c09921 [Mucor ambiguus]|uniref:Uncharacterized protein n=1 Tax=Mucor ambiguus TaxID=91626 RepID=A0A0C9MHX6_9FUNG|nr:hypothetical protein MAM1_0349c09921 [Mucor ambiguus]
MWVLEARLVCQTTSKCGRYCNSSDRSAFFEQKFRASTIRSTVVIETTIKVLEHVNIPLNIATNVSFKDENESDKGSTANAVEANKAINDHLAKQQSVDDVALPLNAKYSEI